MAQNGLKLMILPHILPGAQVIYKQASRYVLRYLLWCVCVCVCVCARVLAIAHVGKSEDNPVELVFFYFYVGSRD